MLSQTFPFHQGLPTITLSFAHRVSGQFVVRRLLVDSGFTGECDLLLSIDDCRDFRISFARSKDVGGALTGTHRLVWVKCALPELNFEKTVRSLEADLSTMSLADGIDGLVGLSFLTRFAAWGGRESNGQDQWDFFLER